MTKSTMIEGKDLTITIDSVDYKCDITNCVMDSEPLDTDALTFCDAANYTEKWFFTVTAIQSTDADSFHQMLWANSGTTVAFVFAPHGNGTVTADEPHYTGNLIIGKKPKVGGTANTNYVFEYRLDIVGEPVKDDTP